MSDKRFYVTIDTEIDADIHWKKGDPISFSSVEYGIEKYLRPIFDEYDVNPIYFVSPEVLENDKCVEVLKREIARDAIIGAHLHGDYIEPDKKDYSEVEVEKFPCFGFDYETEKSKLSNLKKLIKDKLDIDVRWYRAARFGADDDTIRILNELGFLYDSSFTPNINWMKKGGPDFSAIKNGSYDIKDENGKLLIKEYPVSIMNKRFGLFGRLLPDNWLFYEWLRPTHMTYFEEKRLINKLIKDDINDLVMMFHSMEIMINKTPYVRNKFMQDYYLWRLRKTLKYLKDKGFKSYENK